MRATSSWNGVPYRSYPAGTPELTVMRMTIPARSALPWHVHGMPNAAYVLSGELRVEEKRTGKTARYGAGQALAEAVDDIHRGMTGDEPAVLILFYAGMPKQPPSVRAGPE